MSNNESLNHNKKFKRFSYSSFNKSLQGILGTLKTRLDTLEEFYWTENDQRRTFKNLQHVIIR
jgi:hypothetical protein